MDNVVDDLNSLASVGIDDGSDLRFSRDDVADVEGGGGDTTSIRKPFERVVQVEEVTAD